MTVNSDDLNAAPWLGVPWLTDPEVRPVFHGPYGSAWRFAKDDDQSDPRWKLKVGDGWLIYAPRAHPVWAWHVAMGIALREEPGVQSANKHYPEAEYEILVMALNPEKPAPDPRIWPFPGLAFLEPPDVTLQFHGVSDEVAGALLAACVEACVFGLLVPDTDHRAGWRERIPEMIQAVGRQ